MDKQSNSPRITHLSWGRLEVEGFGSFKDAKLFPGGARDWDWRETGTDHSPGIQPADVDELLEHGAKVIILTLGINEGLRVHQDTLKKLERLNIPTHVLQTEKAMELYNQLIKKEPIGALFHTTC